MWKRLIWKNIKVFGKKKNRKPTEVESTQKPDFTKKGECIIYEFNGYKLKPDCCYRKAGSSEIEHYKKTGIVDPIPMSEVRIIQGSQSSESQDLKRKAETDEISTI